MPKTYFSVVCFSIALLAGCAGGGGENAQGAEGFQRMASGSQSIKPDENSSLSSVALAPSVPAKQSLGGSIGQPVGNGEEPSLGLPAGDSSDATAFAAGPTPPSETEPPKASAPVPDGQAAPYDPSALPIVSSEPSASALWPSWRRNMRRWEWKQIVGSDLSAVLPNPPVPGAVSARIDAWNGLAADTRTSRLFSAGNGGHADYSGNEVYEIDLSVDAPMWRMLRAPTAKEFIVASNQTKGIYHDYYLDGRPSSTHTYYALNFIASRNAIFKFGAGSLWGTGNEANWKTDAFSLASRDWQPAGSWPDVMPGTRRSVLAASTCMNPATEEAYVGAPRLRRFNPITGQFSELAPWPDDSSAVYATACAVDPIRKRVVYFRDLFRKPLGGLVYDIAANRFSRIVFQGEAAAEIMKHGYNFAWYEPKVGQFLFKTRDARAVYSVDPESWEVRRVATIGGESMPDAMNGVHTRWQRMPNLGGYAFYPKHGNGVWFLAIE